MNRPALLALLLLAGCADTPGKWSAYVYPNAQDRSQWQPKSAAMPGAWRALRDRFKTEGMCRQAAKESIARLAEPRKAAWRCLVLQPI